MLFKHFATVVIGALCLATLASGLEDANRIQPIDQLMRVRMLVTGPVCDASSHPDRGDAARLSTLHGACRSGPCSHPLSPSPISFRSFILTTPQGSFGDAAVNKFSSRTDAQSYLAINPTLELFGAPTAAPHAEDKRICCSKDCRYYCPDATECCGCVGCGCC
jgi:hypothetical protein